MTRRSDSASEQSESPVVVDVCNSPFFETSVPDRGASAAKRSVESRW